ncbi:larval cuticle protein A3A-like [Lepeophtheirus salmonis]|uniref:larval cuticle protein A3A-like n=1 Tax=Lepeophtheirus salmonis TaxID=72036 RepID=UPI003AF37153
MIGKFIIVCIAVTCALADKPAPPAPVYYRPYPPPPPPPTTTTTTTPAPPAYKPYHPLPPPPPPPPPPASYAYNYAVLDEESSVDFSADELAENGVVSGSYKVVLPDGRIKTITYTVEGDSGFVADVQFETTPSPAPAPYPKYVPYHA